MHYEHNLDFWELIPAEGKAQQQGKESNISLNHPLSYFILDTKF